MNLHDIENKLSLGTANNDDIFNMIRYGSKNETDTIPQDTDSCDCGNTEIINEKGYKVCTECGLILGDLYNKEGEWRNYADSDGKDNVRCNFLTNVLLPQSTLGTNIGGNGKNLMKKLHVWSSVPYKERKVMKVFKKIEKKCEQHNIPGYIEHDAKILYKNVSEAKYVKKTDMDNIMILRGSNEIGLIAACLYYACKKKGYIFSINEMRIIFNISKPKMTNGCKIFKCLLKIRQMDYDISNHNPSNYINRILEQVLMETYYDECIKICNYVDKLNISTQHTPLSTAAAVVIFVSDIHNLGVTSEEIATIVCMSKTTIEKCYFELKKFKKILISETCVNKLLTKLGDKKFLNIPIEFENRYNDLVKNYDSYIDNEEDEIMFNNPLNYTRKAVIDKANKKQYALNYKKL